MIWIIGAAVICLVLMVIAVRYSLWRSGPGRYVGMSMVINGESREIVEYKGTTKTATISHPFTQTPSTNDLWEIRSPNP